MSGFKGLIRILYFSYCSVHFCWLLILPDGILILFWRYFFHVVGFLLLTSRAEIRPEGFSVFFVALDFWLLQRFLQRSISDRVLLIVIPIIQIFWVNTHIFFFMGPVLVGLFLWQAKLTDESKERLGILQTIAC